MTTADQPFYLLDVYALLSCDANSDNDSVRIIGNVNIVDNGILSILTPASTPCAMGGTVAKVEVRLFNNGIHNGARGIRPDAKSSSPPTPMQTRQLSLSR